jgi:hypothetical protein
MCHTAKLFRPGHLVPTCIVKNLVQYVPQDMHLYLIRTNSEPACCQQALFGTCSQCTAIRVHVAKMWSIMCRVRAHGHSVAGRNILDALVNDVLELHLYMQCDDDYEPVYAGHEHEQSAL